MNTCHAAEPLMKAVCSPGRDLLSLREVVTLADVSERRVRKDIETGLLRGPSVVRLPDARLCFAWYHVFAVAAVYGNSFLSSRLRKVAMNRLHEMVMDDEKFVYWREPARFVIDNNCCSKRALELDKYVWLDLEMVSHSVRPRVGIYAGGLARIEEKKDILGGDAVFRGTRLPVAHIGKMVVDGEKVANIVEDYNILNEDDVRFAELYYRAHPPMGRPPKSGEGRDVGAMSGT